VTIAEYLDAIKECLLTSPDVSDFWDNTPHFPGLPGFPHHVHDGRTGTVGPGQPASIFVVLEEVTRLLA